MAADSSSLRELDEEITFDSNDEVSYYYANLSREEVREILQDASIGTFLIRNSTQDDQKVLCVKEASKTINNYKIIHKLLENKNNENDRSSNQSYVFFLYGKEECLFNSIQDILKFYSNHYLNQSPLIKPAFFHKKAIAIYDFLESKDPNEDLYFKKGEILTVIEYTQGETWWKASNQSGSVGLIPATYIRRLKPNEWPLIRNENFDKTSQLSENSKKVSQPTDQEEVVQDETSSNDEKNFQCPFKARVIEDYTPSPYEHSCISLRKGQIVQVLEMRSMGKWYGMLLSDNKKGLFPFNRVEILNE